MIFPMDSSTISMTVAIVLLVMMSAYFSATETAFSCLNKIRMKSRAESGDHRAALAMDLVEDYDRLISTILIGNNIVNITASTVGTVLFTKLYAAYGPTVSTVVLTLVVLIFGEISPKSLAKEHAESFAMFSAPDPAGVSAGPAATELPVLPVEAAAEHDLPPLRGPAASRKRS